MKYDLNYTHIFGPILDVESSCVLVRIFMTGAKIPIMRLKAEHNASPVPLCGAENTSGVYAYSTPYIFKNASILSRAVELSDQRPTTFLVRTIDV